MSSFSNTTSGVHNATRNTWSYIVSVHCPMAILVDRTLTPLWYVIGLTGNTISAKIWSDRRMRKNNSSAVYLAALSISDLVFLLLHSLQELRYAWLINSLGVPIVCEGYFLLVLVAQYLSPALVLGFTVERFIAVCRPFSKEMYCTSSRALKVVACLVIVCTSLCSIQSYFWTYNSAYDECRIRDEVTMGGDTSLWSVWTWATEMVIFLVIPLTILAFNVLVIREVRRVTGSELKMAANQATPVGGRNLYSGGATTAMLLSVSFYVIVTTLPATLVYVLHPEFPEGDYSLTDREISQDPVWRRHLIYIMARKIVEEVCLSHYACNVFLYLVTGAQFRKSFVNLFCRCSNARRTHSNDERTVGGTGGGAGTVGVTCAEIVRRESRQPGQELAAQL